MERGLSSLVWYSVVVQSSVPSAVATDSQIQMHENTIPVKQGYLTHLLTPCPCNAEKGRKDRPRLIFHDFT